MNFYEVSALHQARRLAMVADAQPRVKERSAETPFCPELDSPTLAGYIVYVVTVIGFVMMCVLCAVR